MERTMYVAFKCNEDGTSHPIGGISTTSPQMAEYFKARFAGREDIIIYKRGGAR